MIIEETGLQCGLHCSSPWFKPLGDFGKTKPEPGLIRESYSNVAVFPQQ